MDVTVSRSAGGEEEADAGDDSGESEKLRCVPSSSVMEKEAALLSLSMSMSSSSVLWYISCKKKMFLCIDRNIPLLLFEKGSYDVSCRKRKRVESLEVEKCEHLTVIRRGAVHYFSAGDRTPRRVLKFLIDEPICLALRNREGKGEKKKHTGV